MNKYYVYARANLRRISTCAHPSFHGAPYHWYTARWLFVFVSLLGCVACMHGWQTPACTPQSIYFLGPYTRLFARFLLPAVQVTAAMRRDARKQREAERTEKEKANRKDREEIFEVRQEGQRLFNGTPRHDMFFSARDSEPKRYIAKCMDVCGLRPCSPGAALMCKHHSIAVCMGDTPWLIYYAACSCAYG